MQNLPAAPYEECMQRGLATCCHILSQRLCSKSGLSPRCCNARLLHSICITVCNISISARLAVPEKSPIGACYELVGHVRTCGETRACRYDVTGNTSVEIG